MGVGIKWCIDVGVKVVDAMGVERVLLLCARKESSRTYSLWCSVE